jgi:hypothetical protein
MPYHFQPVVFEIDHNVKLTMFLVVCVSIELFYTIEPHAIVNPVFQWGNIDIEFK